MEKLAAFYSRADENDSGGPCRIKVVSQSLPCMVCPRSLSALGRVSEAAKNTEENEYEIY